MSALTRAMARDLGPHGITVNTVSPGLTETEAAAKVPEHRHELYRDNRALDRRPAVPADVVGADRVPARPRGRLHHRPAARRQRRLRPALTPTPARHGRPRRPWISSSPTAPAGHRRQLGRRPGHRAVLLEEGAQRRHLRPRLDDRSRRRSPRSALPGGDRVLAAVLRRPRPRPRSPRWSTPVEARFGGLDGLVNNAGQSRMKPLAEATLEDFARRVRPQVRQACSTPGDAALPLLRTLRRAAAIVNINAVLAKQPEPRLVTTRAARAGLLNLSKSHVARARRRRHPGQLGVASAWSTPASGGAATKSSGTDRHFAEWEAEIAADRGIAPRPVRHAPTRWPRWS